MLDANGAALATCEAFYVLGTVVLDGAALGALSTFAAVELDAAGYSPGRM